MEPFSPKCKTSLAKHKVWGRKSVRAMCFSCGQGYMTRLEYRVTRKTHKMALVFSLLLLCWLPYTLKCFKDVYHHCGACGAMLGVPPWELE